MPVANRTELKDEEKIETKVKWHKYLQTELELSSKMRNLLLIIFLLLLLSVSFGGVQTQSASSQISYDKSSGSYDDISVVVHPNKYLNASHCPLVLRNLKVSSASF